VLTNLRRVGQLASVALVAGLLGLLVWKVAHGSGKTAEPTNFSLPRLDAPEKLSLASLRGHVVVVNFFASWCPPCKQEAGIVESAWRQFRARGVVFVGIDSKDFSGDARGFMHRYGVTYPVVRDADGAVWGPYGVVALPETRLIDARGRYASHQFYRPLTQQQIDQAIRSALHPQRS
jgi:cytochrome c biogenesis protein CcmG/thiol:disulfide interchange protein DsbE